MSTDISEISWAPRVSKKRIRRLYLSEAEGMINEALLDDVGMSLYMRCQSILTVGQAQRGRVLCPRCERNGQATIIPRRSPKKEEVLACPTCSWSVTWGEYHRTYKKKQLSEGGAGLYFRNFSKRYEIADTPKRKMLAIDRLIHQFHHNILKGQNEPTRAVGVNLIKGTLTEVVAFLNQLTYGGDTDRRIVKTREAWRSTLQEIKWHPKA